MILIIIKLIIVAFFANLLYELVHSALYKTCLEMPVKKYVPLILRASGVDSVWITGFYLITYFIFKNLNPLTNYYQLLVFFIISISFAYFWEIYSTGRLPNNHFTAIFIFCLRLCKNFSTYVKHMFQNFFFASPKIWKFRYKHYSADDLVKNKRWEYSKNMPLVLGVGFTALIELFLTGILSFYITFAVK